MGIRMRALINLALARTCRHFESATQKFTNSFFPHRRCYFIFGPAGATTPAYLPDHSIGGAGRRKFRDGLDRDYWFRRCPPEAGRTTIVRHSDHTPFSDLRRTGFYRQHLLPYDHHFGISILFWDKAEFMGCMTFLRSFKEGDFSNSHIACLKVLHDSILRDAVSRLAEHYRLSGENFALREALHLNSQADAIIRKPGTIVAASKLGLRIIEAWENGREIHKLVRKKLMLPQALREFCDSGIRRNHSRWKVEISKLRSADRQNGPYCLIRFADAPTVDSAIDQPKLTFTERDILMRIAEGKSNREIAKERRKAPSTVKNQISAMLKKFNLRNRLELAVWRHQMSNGSSNMKPRKQVSKKSGGILI